VADPEGDLPAASGMTTPVASAAPDSRMDVFAAPQRLVPVARRRKLNLLVMGEGGPTVVLAAGFLGLTLDWARVQPFVARSTRVVSFDNAGLGFSGPGRGPRTSGAIVEDLHRALQHAGLPPPYVLVGHSAGGLRMRLFAARYPDEVVGLVMIDTVLADWEDRLYGGPSPGLAQEREVLRRLLAMSLAGTLTPDAPDYRVRIGLPRADLTPAMNDAMHRMWTRPSYLRTAISESLNQRATTDEEQAADRRPLGDLPMVVLSAGRISETEIAQNDQQVEAWFKMHEEIAGLSSVSVRRTIDCAHNIPIEDPRAVVAAVEEVVSMARGKP
jgi:pimeloyl-ACP methyl ester carboxylesterase